MKHLKKASHCANVQNSKTDKQTNTKGEAVVSSTFEGTARTDNIPLEYDERISNLRKRYSDLTGVPQNQVTNTNLKHKFVVLHYFYIFVICL